eukprot:scaffold113491_cov31-Cyclotella_meneghiniana.AAC.1
MVRPVRSTSANRINNFWLDKKLDAVEDLLGNTMMGVVVEGGSISRCTVQRATPLAKIIDTVVSYC